MRKLIIKQNKSFLSRRACLKRPVLTARQMLFKNSFSFRIRKWRYCAKKIKVFKSRHTVAYGVLRQGGELKLWEVKQSSRIFSVVLKIVEDSVSQVYLLILVNSSQVFSFIRGIFIVIGVILCSPEYTFCMELSLNGLANPSGQDMADSLPVFSNVESTFDNFESFLRDSRKAIRNPKPGSEFNLDDYHKQLDVYSNQFQTASDEIREVDTKTHTYNRLSDLKQRLDDLKQIAINQQKPVSDHNSLLEPTNSPLWAQLKNSSLTSIFTASTASTALVLTLVVLVRTSKAI